MRDKVRGTMMINGKIIRYGHVLNVEEEEKVILKHTKKNAYKRADVKVDTQSRIKEAFNEDNKAL